MFVTVLILLMSSPERADDYCAFQASSRLEIVDRTARYCGVLGADMADRLRATRPDAWDVLEIKSAGGSPFAALSVAALLEERDARLRFTGLCASACIGLYAEAPVVDVGRRALFINHDAAIGRLAMVLRTEAVSNAGAVGLDAHRAEQAQSDLAQLVAAARSDVRRVAIESTAAIGPRCSGFVEDGVLGLSRFGAPVFESEYEWWLPMEATLLRWRGDRQANGLAGAYDSGLRARVEANIDFLHGRSVRPLLSDDQVAVAYEWFMNKERFALCD